MKYFATMIGLAVLMSAGAASACPVAGNSTIRVDCENGVAVYRGTPLKTRRTVAVQQPTIVINDIANQRLALQNERLAAQSERIGVLETQLAGSANNTRKTRYGRTYYGSPFLFGTRAGRIGPRRTHGRRVARSRRH